jgi:hypothetical protein
MKIKRSKVADSVNEFDEFYLLKEEMSAINN